MRAVEGRSMFADDRDRKRFVQRLGEAVQECGVRLYLFTLMRTHVHLLAETPRGNVSAFMQKLQTAYTVYYNRRHQRVGHLMQGRFGAVYVQGNRYLLKLSRYIHLNPVCVGELLMQEPAIRRERLRAYAWSSYCGYAGLDRPFPFVDEEPVLALMEAPANGQRAAYRQFVETGLAETDREFVDLLRTSRWGIGDEEFRDRIRDRHTDMTRRVKRPEDVSFRKVSRAVDADVVLRRVAEAFGIDGAALRRRQYACVARSVAAWMLCRHAAMNQRDVATFLGLGSGSAVCQQMKALRVRIGCEPELARCVAMIDADIASAR
jgi:REP element-mobilizing transposase RayT